MLLIGNVLKPLTNGFLIPLGLTASATNAAIHMKMFGSGTHPSDLASRTTLIISNEEMNDIMKIVKFLEESGSLIKGVTQTIKNEAKEQKEGILGMFLGTLGASLLGNILKGKGDIATSQRRDRSEEAIATQANMSG